MSDHSEFDSISFDLPKNQSNVIKSLVLAGEEVMPLTTCRELME